MLKKLIYMSLVFGLCSTCWGKEVVESGTFENWRVELRQDKWGDEKEVILYGQNGVTISINPEFGFVRQDYNFERLRNYWPYCEVTNFTYRIDGGAPLKTGMGGEAAQGAHCAWVSMPNYMLKDMKRGSKLEVRAGYSNPRRKAVSLEGFSAAWDFAVSLCKTPPKVESWMKPIR